jgi:Polyketide cyclase / dehydrase and lipid transport
MASIHQETTINVGADQAWGALRQVGQIHKTFAPVVTATRLDNDVRTVSFANGVVVDELILCIDDERRRVAWSVVNSAHLKFHHGSMQVIDLGPDRCRFVWVCDYMPAEAGVYVRPLMEQGTQALKRNLEANNA